jgi:hypothetical protein
MTDRGGAAHPLVELTLARLREFIREPEAVFWVFAFPLLLAFALGIAFRSKGETPVHAGVVDGPGAVAIVAALERGGGLDVRLVPASRVRIVSIRPVRRAGWPAWPSTRPCSESAAARTCGPRGRTASRFRAPAISTGSFRA